MAWFIAVLKHRLGTLTNSPVCLNQCSFCLEICMVYHLLMHSLVLFHKCSKHPLRYESLLAESVNFVQKNGLGGSVYSRFLSIILFAKLIPVNQSGTKSCSKFGEHFFFFVIWSYCISGSFTLTKLYPDSEPNSEDMNCEHVIGPKPVYKAYQLKEFICIAYCDKINS